MRTIASHLAAAMLTVGGSVLVAGAAYFLLLAIAVVTNGDLGGPLGLPAMLLAALVFSLVAVVVALAPATLAAHAIAHHLLHAPAVVEIPLSTLFLIPCGEAVYRRSIPSGMDALDSREGLRR